MRTFGVFAIACLVGLASASIRAQVYSGRADFSTYCTSCHGAKGAGDGVIAATLAKRPPDLTKLALNNDGKYPAERVFKSIDGREPVAGHTKADMPAWIDVFAKSSDSDGPGAAKARIDALVRHLETLQEKR
jgi:mono/diheme cytochrome c family protein